ASYITMKRELPPLYRDQAGLPGRIENQRLAAELGYDLGPWSFYINLSAAEPDTPGTTASRVTAHAPGFKYNYGPGWVYVEYLTQDGFVERDGRLGEGDFDALYLTIDFYL